MGELDGKAERGLKEQEPLTPPGGFGVRHFQIFLYFLGMVFGYALRVIISIAIVAMTDFSENANPDFEVYNWTSSEQGLIKSSFFWGYAVTQVPSGYVAGIWSAQKLLSFGMLACSLATIAIPLLVKVGDWPIVCACRVIMGLTQACLLPCVQTLLARWVPPAERARLGTFAYAGAQVGTVITMPISGWLASSMFGWPSIFHVFGALGLGWSILFFLLGSDSPANHSSISEHERRYIEFSLNQNQSKKKLTTPWKEIFTSLPMWALIIVHCGQNWGFWMLLTEIPTFMSEVIGYPISENGVISALPYLAMWLLSFPASWLSDYALRQGAGRGCIRKTSNSVGHWGPGLALLALSFVGSDQPELAICLLVVAVGLNACSYCGFQINHIDLSPNFAGVMMSITNCIAALVAIAAPLISAEIVTDKKNVSQWHTVFYISALIYFLGNLVFVVFGSGEVQWWNEPASLNPETQRVKRSYPIATISAAYDESKIKTPVSFTYQKSEAYS